MHPAVLPVNTEQAEGKGVGQPELQEEQQRLEEEQRQQEQQQLKQQEENEQQRQQQRAKREELDHIAVTANATAAAVMVIEEESASTMQVATQQYEIADVLPQLVVVSAVASPISTPAVAGRIRKSDYEKMSTRLLEAMEASEKDWPAKDLLEWYITEHASDQDTTARDEISQQLEHVLRRMIKHDKSVVDVKSTVKGSKRLEDKVLRTKSFANKLHAEHLAAKKADESAAAAAIAAASESAEKERLLQVAEEEAKEQARLLAVKAEELERIVATANATAAAVMMNEVESASTMKADAQQNEIAEVQAVPSVVVSAVASPISTPAVAGRIRKSDYEKMSTRLLEAMEASEKDWPAKDLLEWYITEHASDQDTTARDEISQQLEHVLRRMIKHDKSVVDVKSTVKGSKRLEDKVLRTKSFANKLHAEHLAAKKADESAAAAAIAAASESAEKGRLLQVAEEEAKEQARLLAVKAEEDALVEAELNRAREAIIKAEEHERRQQELHHQAERRREEKEWMERELEAQLLSEKAALAAAALEALAIKMDEERKHAEAVAEAERIRVQLETERMARQLADEQAALKAIADADAAAVAAVAAAAAAAKALEEDKQRRQKERELAEQEKQARELVEQEEREKIARKLVEQEQEERKKQQEQQAREQAAREEKVSPPLPLTLVTTPHSIYLSHTHIPFPISPSPPCTPITTPYLR